MRNGVQADLPGGSGRGSAGDVPARRRHAARLAGERPDDGHDAGQEHRVGVHHPDLGDHARTWPQRWSRTAPSRCPTCAPEQPSSKPAPQQASARRHTDTRAGCSNGRGAGMRRSSDHEHRHPAESTTPSGTASAPLLRLRGVSKNFGAGPGAHRRRLRGAGGRGDRAHRRQRRRQVGADQVHRGHPRPRPWRDPVGGRTGAHPHAARRGAARHRDRVPGPRALRTTSTSSRTCSSAASACAASSWTRRRWRPRPRETLDEPRRDHRAVDPPAGGLALGRPAPVGRDRQGGALELQARDHGRADGRARRRPDRHGARARPPAGRPRARRDDRLAQHERRVRGRRPDRRAAPRADGRRAAGRPSSTRRSRSTS